MRIEKAKRGISHSDYDQCNIFLLSAFFCLIGNNRNDAHLRKMIEDAIVALHEARNITSSAQVLPFVPRKRRSPRQPAGSIDQGSMAIQSDPLPTGA